MWACTGRVMNICVHGVLSLVILPSMHNTFITTVSRVLMYVARLSSSAIYTTSWWRLCNVSRSWEPNLIKYTRYIGNWLTRQVIIHLSLVILRIFLCPSLYWTISSRCRNIQYALILLNLTRCQVKPLMHMPVKLCLNVLLFISKLTLGLTLTGILCMIYKMLLPVKTVLSINARFSDCEHGSWNHERLLVTVQYITYKFILVFRFRYKGIMEYFVNVSFWCCRG